MRITRLTYTIDSIRGQEVRDCTVFFRYSHFVVIADNNQAFGQSFNNEWVIFV